jgi:hypothetical protein
MAKADHFGFSNETTAAEILKTIYETGERP